MPGFYTGVGSRQTPQPILDTMTAFSRKLSSQDHRWVLRSGHADGADQAFEAGASKKILYYAHSIGPDQWSKQALELASRFHPAWSRLSDYVKKLHARNVFQVMGSELDSPSSFLICWTKDGATTHAERSIRTGGTGTAISIADHFKVPVFNLAKPDHLARIHHFLYP